MELLVTGEGRLHVEQDHGPGTRVSIRAHPNQKTETLENAMVYLRDPGLLFGMAGSGTLAKVLRQSTLTSRIDRPAGGGDSWVLLEGRGRFGTYRVWLDPAANYLPRRIEIDKAAIDLAGDSGEYTVASFPFENSDGVYHLRERMRSTKTLVHNIEVTSVNETPTISAFSRTYTREYESGATMVFRNECVIEEMRLGDPGDEAFALTIEVPDGNDVFVVESPQIQYVWRDGQVQKAVDSTAMGRLGDLNFAQPGSKARYVTFIALNVLVVAVIAWWIFRRRSASR